MAIELTRRRFLEVSAAAAAAFSLSSTLGAARAAAAPGTRAIFDSAPASTWSDAFLSGNGRYGVMVNGDPLAETVIFNDHKFLQPNGSYGTVTPVVSGELAQTRADLLAGNYSTAQTEFADDWTLEWTQPFHPGYQMSLTVPSDGPVSGYSRTLNFETGEITVAWTDSRGAWTRRTFVSRADNVIVQQLTAPSNGTLSVTVELSAALAGAPSTLVVTNNVYTSGGDYFLNLRAQYDSSASDPGYEGVTWAVPTGGTTAISGSTLTVTGATSLLLLTRTDRYATSTWNTTALQAELTALSTTYTTLLNRHTAIHQPIYDRVTIDLNGGAADRALSTTALIAKQIANPGTLNPALLEKMFDAGRYHFLSSSGYMPPRLTGLWLGEWGAAWSDDFTTDANINLQMAGGSIGNMSELVISYNNMILGEIAQWQTNATNIYGANGILAGTRTDGSYGYQLHFDTGFPGQMWTGGADWLLYPIYEYCLVNGDTSYLEGTLWPWLYQLALFYQSFLSETDSNGNYVFVPSFSPENAPANTGVDASINATMDIAAGKHALQTAIAVANLLGVQQAAAAQWSALLDRLPPYLINSDGALQEWSWPTLTDQYAHRHVSHLYPVWPLHEITPDTGAALSVAAETALLKRSNPDQAAHGYLHRALAHSRLKDGSNAAAMLLDLLPNNYVFRSLMTSHYPDLNTYNADTAHTLPAVLIEMLVDSQPGSAVGAPGGTIELLPALPATLPQGAITGVRTRNQVTVTSMAWNLPALTVTATLTSDITQSITLINRRGIAAITSGATVSASTLGSFARVLALKAGAATQVAITLPATACCQLINRNSGLALDITGASTANGTAAIQWPTNGNANQIWQLVPNPDGSFKLINQNSGNVLDNPGSSTTDGTQMDQWSDTSSSNQWWNLVEAEVGYYHLVNDRNGLYLDVSGASLAEGAAVIQWPSDGGLNQQWQIVSV